MATHTPGPTMAHGRRIFGENGGLAIGMAYFDGTPGLTLDVAEANARLWAAGPELLTACLYAADMLRQTVPDGSRMVPLAERLAGLGGAFALTLLDAAIAKAAQAVAPPAPAELPPAEAGPSGEATSARPEPPAFREESR